MPSPADVIKLSHLWVGSCGVHRLDKVHANLLGVEPPSVGRHNGDYCADKYMNLRRKIVSLYCD
jgi:hypothetical protein